MVPIFLFLQFEYVKGDTAQTTANALMAHLLASVPSELCGVALSKTLLTVYHTFVNIFIVSHQTKEKQKIERWKNGGKPKKRALYLYLYVRLSQTLFL